MACRAAAAPVMPAAGLHACSRPLRPAPHAAATRHAPAPRTRLLAAPRAATGPGDTRAWYQPGDASPDQLLELLRERRRGDAAAAAASAGGELAAPPPLSTVHLVGTGPGDPGLLTLKAAQLMQTADVVLYDRLVSEDVLQLVHPGALLLYVGKQRGFHTRSQDEIHELLLQFASVPGATVLRLKGGDPCVFGRGGEEAEYLEQHGVRVRVVPGITAAAGISAELGIPLTHRGLATSVRFLTGHAREGGEAALDASVAAAADPHTTLVVYMGLGTLLSLTAQLEAAGLSMDTPAVAVERGTTPEQRAVYATLGALCCQVEEARLTSPTLIVIGEVVSLAPGWRRFRATGRSLDDGGAADAAEAASSSSSSSSSGSASAGVLQAAPLQQ